MKIILMKSTAIIKKANLVLILMALGVTVLSGCSEEIKDFGFDGKIQGSVLDQNGNVVAGDASNAELTVFILGAEDRVPLELRVNNDGTYANLHLFPQSYSLWIEGPVVGPSESNPINVDLNGGLVENDITVTPFLVIDQPTATISDNTISINYNISPSSGHMVDEIKILVSTVKKVGVDTGNGPRWQTREENPVDNSGTQTVELDEELLNAAAEGGNGELTIRVAAKSDQTTAWNLSLPLVIAL
ncbi:uncharacterized protein DUF3823 [Flavobacteriaceae bacterium MAR_2009_75]|nr:uncharacterized protein DUF3823 [Flavobacteriaceae bacterium MAR_2009_75]